ncbi:Major Facilitator Superfamily [Pseudomonas amygdali pv. photiniae]|uniref:Major Facilitator Superfamily n=1 Tax=Pseudomonas amygdali pv. photiniae TaxID=251724 RepID=A0A0P9WZ73_PSEA0|nr:MFS transporter [Pseudomonas amygdali]KPX56956.1 Major Facilitator Superfamily [Pseudomonas amygdali pv. photiniae]RMS50254.1 Major Facilitator Superfamily [Pseudomonas amygdali pv. photiniae]
MYLIFFGFFAAEGIIYPFWPTWLESLGFSAGQIGLLIAAVYWPQVVTGVLITYVADWRVDQIRLAAILGFSAAFSTLLFYFLPAQISVFVTLSVIFGGLWMVVLPLSESYLLKRDKQALQNYGWVRAVGSSAFILTSTLGGLIFTYYGQSWVPIVIASSMLLTGLSCLWLKNKTSKEPAPLTKHKLKRPEWRQLIKNKCLLLAIAAAGFIQLSHTLYFSTASINWGAKGYSSTSIGIFWSIAVLAEITYFTFSNKILARWSPLPLVIFSSGCAAIRWIFFSSSEATVVIVLGQCMHALTFAAYHSAIMRFIRDNTPQDIQAFTQGVYYSLAVALPMGLATPFSGYMYETMQTGAYYVMALLALAGTFLALIAHNKMRKYNHDSTKLFGRLL